MRAIGASSVEEQAAALSRPRVARRVPALSLAWPLAVVALVVGTLLVRLPSLDLPLGADEGGYATAAYWWARGDTLYADITITRPQGIFVVFRLIETAGLGSPRGIHLAAAGFVALSALLLLAIAARLWGRGIGLGAAALFAMVMAGPTLEGTGANAEIFMTPPLLLSLWTLLRADESALDRPRSLWLLAGSGILGAVALLIKPSGAAALVLAALWLVRRGWAERATAGSWSRAALTLGLGTAAGLGPALAHGLVTAPERYLDAVLLYRLQQDSVVGGGIGDQLDALRTNSLYILARLPILLLAPIGLIDCGLRIAGCGIGDDSDSVASRRWSGPRRAYSAIRNPQSAFLWLWLATAFAGTALGGNWFLHYYQQLLPPLAIAAALGLRAILPLARRPGRIAGQMLAALGVATLLTGLASDLAAGADPTRSPAWEPGVAAAAPVAAWVRARTTPDDTIYVLYDHADIYYLAGRRPAARWLHWRELRWTPGAFDEQVARLADPAGAPRYIIGAQRFERFGFDADGTLAALVARDYTLETTIEGVPIYGRKDRAALP